MQDRARCPHHVRLVLTGSVPSLHSSEEERAGHWGDKKTDMTAPNPQTHPEALAELSLRNRRCARPVTCRWTKHAFSAPVYLEQDYGWEFLTS